MRPAGTIDGFRSETVAVDGVRLHYWIAAAMPTRQPVLLWHGFLSTGYAWHKIAPGAGRRPASLF